MKLIRKFWTGKDMTDAEWRAYCQLSIAICLAMSGAACIAHSFA